MDDRKNKWPVTVHGPVTVSMEGLADGMYVLRVESKDFRKTAKIVLAH